MYHSPAGYRSRHTAAGKFARRGRYPLLSEAIAGGLYHYGCKCWHVSFFESITQTDDHGESLPSFVDYDPGFNGSSNSQPGRDVLDAGLDYQFEQTGQTASPDQQYIHRAALYAVRQHLQGQGVNPTAPRGFFARRNTPYRADVPEVIQAPKLSK